MILEFKVTEIFCMTNDFCKEFTLQQGKYMIEDKKSKHRNKFNRMRDAEIMVIFPISLRWFPLLQAVLQGICQ